MLFSLQMYFPILIYHMAIIFSGYISEIYVSEQVSLKCFSLGKITKFSIMINPSRQGVQCYQGRWRMLRQCVKPWFLRCYAR